MSGTNEAVVVATLAEASFERPVVMGSETSYSLSGTTWMKAVNMEYVRVVHPVIDPEDPGEGA